MNLTGLKAQGNAGGAGGGWGGGTVGLLSHQIEQLLRVSQRIFFFLRSLV